MSSFNILTRRAIASWLSWRAERRHYAQTRRFEKAAPEIVRLRHTIAGMKRGHRRRAEVKLLLSNTLHARLSAEVWGE